ncbi:unnamed protein product [Lactuca saligna]|uniref:Uncharacterized protein n=1 Tax=Lactuca saligna TaxID=75948 RepID=A0AA35VDC5_LACSI|nr:unnamed protein product [Lactuca saligna]
MVDAFKGENNTISLFSLSFLSNFSRWCLLKLICLGWRIGNVYQLNCLPVSKFNFGDILDIFYKVVTARSVSAGVSGMFTHSILIEKEFITCYLDAHQVLDKMSDTNTTAKYVTPNRGSLLEQSSYVQPG